MAINLERHSLDPGAGNGEVFGNAVTGPHAFFNAHPPLRGNSLWIFPEV